MTLVVDEPARVLDGINGEGAVQLGRTACHARMVEVVVARDALVVSSAGRIAFQRGGRVVDQIPSLSGSGPLLAGAHP
jgi:hypothetical protein